MTATNAAWVSALAVSIVLGASAACSSNDAESEPPGASGTPLGGAAAGSNQARTASSSAASETGGVGAASSGQSGASHAGAPGSGARANGGGGANGSGGDPGAGASSGGDSGGAGGAAAISDDYDAAVLDDQPVGYWALALAPAKERDLSGHGRDGTYRGQGTPSLASLPNGDSAVKLDGATQYLTIPSSEDFSIPTTGNLTWEAWIRPDVLQFPNDDGSSGYVDWLGKCEDYAPTCEWEARFYNTNTNESPNRPNRLSAYVFNPSAGLGSGADFQPSAGQIKAGSWYHVVGEYTTLREPANCQNTDDFPGSIEIWVNGVKWDHGSHGQTGCMSQYDVVPKANDSPVNVGTMAKESFFQGAIGKLAIYDHLLSPERISEHYTRMTGQQPRGSCGNTCSFE